MTSQDVITHYCERNGVGLWAEPLNAISNLAFLLAAIWILRHLARDDTPGRRPYDLYLLAALLALIGAGSLLWHTLARPWSEWADIIPILLFISVYLLAYLMRIARMSAGMAVPGLVIFQSLNAAVQFGLPPHWLNGSMFYLPAFLVLLGFSVHTRYLGLPQARDFLTGTAVFGLSLGLRSVDLVLCGVWPLGTHFLWHLLNAWVLYRLSLALLPRPERG